MGSSASKVSQSAGTAARRFPTKPSLESSTRTSNTNPQASQAVNAQPGPTVRPQPHASGSRDASINLDASDPDFARSLRSIGPVQPNPTLSPSSAFNQNSQGDGTTPQTQNKGPDPRQNPALLVLDARSRLQDSADLEFQHAGRRGHAGREFLDIIMIRQLLVQRDQYGKSAEEIERRMGLKKGVAARLGKKGVVELVSEQGRAEKGIEIV